MHPMFDVRGGTKLGFCLAFLASAVALAQAPTPTPAPVATGTPDTTSTPDATATPVATSTPDASSTPEPTTTPGPIVPPEAAATPAPRPAGPVSVVGTTEELGELSLEELLDIPIAVAAKIPRPVRESPAVLTVLTADRIAALGARDLTDVLMFVPGFFFGVDLKGVVGLGFRGNWAHEGKVLVLVDGQEINELLYYNVPVGHHLPIDQIERIEIVRGPGSVTYGGSAELGVVNIVTKGAPATTGQVVEASARYGTAGPGAMMRQNASLRWGRRWDDGTAVTLSGFFGEGNQGATTYTDLYGDSFDMAGASKVDDLYLNLGMNRGGFEARLIHDRYRIYSRDGYDYLFPFVIHNEFHYWLGHLKYDAKVGNRVTVTPRLSYRRNTSWRTRQENDYASYYDPVTSRATAELFAAIEPVDSLDLLSGVAYSLDEYWVATSADGRVQEDPEDRLFGGPGKDTYGNAAVFAQALWSTRIVDLSAGARWENHSRFGASFVPRVAATRVFGRFHAKLMGSQAFRAPSMDNIDYNQDIEPERTTAFEAEVGYRLADRLFVTANAFDLTIDDTIVYTVDDEDVDNYYNLGQSGTRGLEVEAQGRVRSADLFGGYAFYFADGKNEVEPYQVGDEPDALLGSPQHKISAGTRVRLPRGLYAGSTVVWLGERWGYLRGDEDGNPVLDRQRSLTMVNAFAGWHSAARRLDVSVGIYNVLDEPYTHIQPYDGAHTPLPAEPREVAARVSIGF